MTNDLPPYEPLRAPLNLEGQRHLRQIKTDRLIGDLQKHLDQANTLITQMAGEVNDRLYEREDEIQRAKTRREQKGREPTQLEEASEAETEKMRERVEKMTRKMEESTRKIIDGQQSLANMTSALDHTREVAHTAAADATSDTQADNPTTTPSILETFQDRMQEEQEQYQTLPHSHRYAEHNSYVGFRRVVHEAQHPDDGAPVPHASTWFTESGEPAPGLISREALVDEDDDLAISRANISTKCPLTLQEMREPVKSLRCPHAFEKSAILEMIGHARNRRVQCPVPGCDKDLVRSEIQEDPILTRRIQRLQKANEAKGYSESEEDEDTDMVDVDRSSRRGTIPPKPEPGSRPKRVRGTVNLDSDEDEE
jgi:E3 SUMO-protein ligase NSE2